MKLGSLVTLGLVNGVISALLFAASLSGIAALLGSPRALVTAPYLFTLLLTVVGPAMLVFDLVAAVIASFARKSRHSAQLAALIVACCLGLAFVGSRIGFAPAGDPLWVARLAFVGALALPWAVGAGFFEVAHKAV